MHSATEHSDQNEIEIYRTIYREQIVISRRWHNLEEKKKIQIKIFFNIISDFMNLREERGNSFRSRESLLHLHDIQYIYRFMYRYVNHAEFAFTSSMATHDNPW